MTAVPAITQLSPFLRHFVLSMYVPSCYNPFESISARRVIPAEKLGKSAFGEHSKELSQWP
jgi:hypothetical protein